MLAVQLCTGCSLGFSRPSSSGSGSSSGRLVCTGHILSALKHVTASLTLCSFPCNTAAAANRIWSLRILYLLKPSPSLRLCTAFLLCVLSWCNDLTWMCARALIPTSLLIGALNLASETAQTRDLQTFPFGNINLPLPSLHHRQLTWLPDATQT